MTTINAQRATTVAVLVAALMVGPALIAPWAHAHTNQLLFLSGAALLFLLADLAMEPVYVRSWRVLAGRTWAIRLYAITALCAAVTL